MKASEALRAGAKLVKGQAVGTLYDEKTKCACAMGAMYIGHGVPRDFLKLESFNNFLYVSQPDFMRAFDAYSEEYGYSPFVDNDENGLSFEQIARRFEEIGE